MAEEEQPRTSVQIKKSFAADNKAIPAAMVYARFALRGLQLGLADEAGRVVYVQLDVNDSEHVRRLLEDKP